jgi:hypothetical protein
MPDTNEPRKGSTRVAVKLLATGLALAFLEFALYGPDRLRAFLSSSYDRQATWPCGTCGLPLSAHHREETSACGWWMPGDRAS